MGDFNAIRYPHEKIGVSQSWSSAKELFNYSILQAGFDDISYSGCHFTWANKQVDGHYIASKIDRVLVNDNWLKTFPFSHAQFCLSGPSDHSPAILSIILDVSREELENIQFKLDRDPGNMEFQSSERILCKKYIDLCQVVGSLAKQKSRIQWLSLGDRNSSFFFRTVRNNINRGRISSITMDNGVRVTKPLDIHEASVSHFSNLLGSPSVGTYDGFGRVNELINKRLSSAQVTTLGQDVTVEEITSAFRSLNPNKALGPDGYSTGFFHSAWDIVGNEVIQAIKSFFDLGELLKEIYCTTVALVLTIPNPGKVGDYRPISCCNTIYECIAKIIANRIKIVLLDIIDLVQSAFVDLMKAYDNVRWDFLFDVLRTMAFPTRARGLRQGDPLSSYLFVIVMEVLARILNEKFLDPQFKFHWRCAKNKIVNLCFADDLMIFCKGHIQSVTLIKQGRAQLISSILFSMQVYWSSLFIIPKKVIKEIEALCRSFLWSGLALKKFGAKVSWDRVCAPRGEEGLGFESMEIWNKAAVSKHIWFLVFGGEQSMWCQWVKSYLLKGHSFWNVKVPSDLSWVWRKLLSLRVLTYPLIKFLVGSGEQTFLWFDNWHPLGPLGAKYGDRFISDTALGCQSKVRSIVFYTGWTWPNESSWEVQEIISNTLLDLIPSLLRVDKVIWVPTCDGNFSIGSAWQHWRTKWPKNH
ncbi:uncharacterized protein LOC114309562 [Camellia sinensis]|uniref:uncharacterized protein LOC114309562 n=1 Tax=Camellia sinensis TaxID=4442 RepID=UPI00103556EF|nr:uncharacterized protein LOC114309562 [Camellia sinensis]